MKKIILFSLMLLLTASVSHAAPLKKPSKNEIKRLIKKMVLKSKTPIFTGIDNPSYTHPLTCTKINIQKIDILKVGRASSNYYERSGNYINSEFKVKFLIKGACTLSDTYRINTYAYNDYVYELRQANRHHDKKPTPVMPMDLKGRVPFRGNIPFEIYILTDDYGDWYAVEHANAFRKEDRCLSDKTTNYLKKLFYKKNRANVKKWKQEQIAAKNRLSDGAERGKRVMQYNRLFTSKVKAQLESQPKRIREFVYGGYWKILQQESHKGSDRFRKSDQFLKEVINQMRLQR